MQVIQEQFEQDLQGPLTKMGYKFADCTISSTYPLIVTNYNWQQGVVSSVVETVKHERDRYFIDNYNPELFLALAAMTDEEFGIAGEWWICKRNPSDEFFHDKPFFHGKLYRSMAPVSNRCAFINEYGKSDGHYPNNLRDFRKATKQEIINWFTREGNNMPTDDINNISNIDDILILL